MDANAEKAIKAAAGVTAIALLIWLIVWFFRRDVF